jgi:hypothetical protein
MLDQNVTKIEVSVPRVGSRDRTVLSRVLFIGTQKEIHDRLAIVWVFDPVWHFESLLRF